ncbi:sulfurtransferase [Clostridium oceanicum]|uniref:Sulfurtransferase n=1 Tax=Clostridium oceanicum TaxID=1543 RepID=A0ABN1JDS3_9CLOT
MKNVVSCDWLKNHMKDENLFIIDCRFDLFDASFGKKAYEKEHIDGAYYLDINKDFADKAKAHGGARPLPSVNTITNKLKDIGINTDSTVIFYDNNFSSSCRAFYELKYLDFEKVYVLNGGFTEWKNLKFPTSKEIPLKKSNGNFNANINSDIFCDMNYVKKAIDNKDILLIDSRGEERYLGNYEPLYSKKGHIPSSLNLPCGKNISEKGTIKDISSLKDNFSFTKNAKEIIVYCGSGIDGAVNFFVLKELSRNVKLYVGSMSDWVSYDENPVNSGRE